jgi:hypothetical protein
MESRPRGTALTLGMPNAPGNVKKGSRNTNGAKEPEKNPTVAYLSQALRSFTHEAREISYKRDKKDPEFTFYEADATIITAYKVKPAVFDLVLSIGIAAYLGVLFLVLQRTHWAYSLLTSALVASSKPFTNGVNGHSNGKSRTH